MIRLPAFFLVSLALCVSGCVTTHEWSPTVEGTGYINGMVTLRPMSKMPPLEARGMKRIGMIVEFEPTVATHEVGVTVFGNQRADSGLVLLREAEVRDIVLDGFRRHSNIAVDDFTDEKPFFSPRVKFSAWDGSARFEPSSELASRVDELRAQGYDAILFLREGRLTDFIGMTNQPLGPKGLYHRFDTVAVYGGFRVWIIDLKTGKESPNTSYVQAVSTRMDGLEWRERLEDYSDEERARITESLREVYRINTFGMLSQLKAVRDAK